MQGELSELLNNYERIDVMWFGLGQAENRYYDETNNLRDCQKIPAKNHH